MIKRGGCLALLTIALVAAVCASSARADGDPASDYLAARQVFLTSQSTSESRAQQQLLSLVGAANRAGFAIRVATIGDEYDLGSITALWRKPRLYARFLGLELSSVYTQRLLVVMPNGFGFNWPGHSASSAYRLLAGVPIGPGESAVTGAAQTAVTRLAAAVGIKLAAAAEVSPRVRTGGKPHNERWVVVVVAAVVAAAGALMLFRSLPRPRRTRPTVASEPSIATGGASSIRLRWAVPGLAVLLAVAAGVPILALRVFRPAGASGAPAGSVVTPPPFSWPAGRRPAPEFVLHDQHGSPVSVAEYRGRPLIVTFVDPLCRNLCPLEAHLLNQVVGGMPVSRRPVIVAVSVDVYADARRNLLQDERQWNLVPEWHWAVGRPSQLAAVWKHYEIGVQVVTKRIAGTTIHYITHTEAAYIIDGTGHERALFVWPFYPQDVERTLQQLS